MVSVIAFVALQFGYIKRAEQTNEEKEAKKDGSLREGPRAEVDMSSMIKGLLNQVAPQIQSMVGGSLAEGPKPKAKKSLQNEESYKSPVEIPSERNENFGKISDVQEDAKPQISFE